MHLPSRVLRVYGSAHVRYVGVSVPLQWGTGLVIRVEGNPKTSGEVQESVMKKASVVMVSLVLAMFCTASLYASTMVHFSHQSYLSDGMGGTGTAVTDCMGLACPSMNFAIGTVSGTEYFQVDSAVFYNGSSSTTYAYALTVDAGSPTVAEFAVIAPGASLSNTAPPGWNFMSGASGWGWLCSPGAASGSCGANSTTNPSLEYFTLTVAGNIAPVWANVGFGIGDGTTVQVLVPQNWQAPGPGAPTTTPEPASLALLASGLLTGGFFLRRKR